MARHLSSQTPVHTLDGGQALPRGRSGRRPRGWPPSRGSEDGGDGGVRPGTRPQLRRPAALSGRRAELSHLDPRKGPAEPTLTTPRTRQALSSRGAHWSMPPRGPVLSPGPLTQGDKPPLRGDRPSSRVAPLLDVHRQSPRGRGPAWTHTLQRAGGSGPAPGAEAWTPWACCATPHPHIQRSLSRGQLEGPRPARGQLGAGPEEGASRHWELTLQLEAGRTDLLLGRSSPQAAGMAAKGCKAWEGRSTAAQAPRAPTLARHPEPPTGQRQRSPPSTAGPLETQGAGLLPSDSSPPAPRTDGRGAGDRRETRQLQDARLERRQAARSRGRGLDPGPPGAAPQIHSDPNFSPRRDPRLQPTPSALASPAPMPTHPGAQQSHHQLEASTAQPSPNQDLPQTSLSHSSSRINPRRRGRSFLRGV